MLPLFWGLVSFMHMRRHRAIQVRQPMVLPRRSNNAIGVARSIFAWNGMPAKEGKDDLVTLHV